jgi:hypothetical protein
MRTTRREALKLLATASLAPNVLAAAERVFETPPDADLAEVERILHADPAEAGRNWQIHYNVSATVLLLSVPIVSRSGVGSGWVRLHDNPVSKNCLLEFAAGSWPERARGLNRLGYIQEAVSETPSGAPSRCAYFAFMTTSREKTLGQAQKALENASGAVPYSAAVGIGRDGQFSSRLTTVDLPAKMNWTAIDPVVQAVRKDMASPNGGERRRLAMATGEEAPFTFLYSVRKAIAEPARTSDRVLVYQGKQYRLKTTKVADPAAGTKFSRRDAGGAVANPERVMRVDATLALVPGGSPSPFTLWYEAGEESALPFRFEYQARSFLRLVFERKDPTPAADTPVTVVAQKEIR